MFYSNLFSVIFTKFPTDQGLCCSFNMKAAEEIFSGDSYLSNLSYPKLLTELQSFDNDHAFVNSSLPRWLVQGNEPKTQFGINKGLTVMLDAHTDIVSAGSINTGFKG
jgi:hypothetical protein